MIVSESPTGCKGSCALLEEGRSQSARPDWHPKLTFSAWGAEPSERRPCLATPGPQPENHDVAGTFAEQIAKARQPRPAKPLPVESAKRLAATVESYAEVFRKPITRLVAEFVGATVASLIRRALRGRRQRKVSTHG